jgi:hypothetical protein
MIPKTEQELEMYFELQFLFQAYKERHKKQYERSPGGEHEVNIGWNLKYYEEKKQEYLEKVKSINL